MVGTRKRSPAERTKHRASAAQPVLTKANYEALADFRHALRTFLAFSTAAAREAGISPQQHQALLAIKGAPHQEALNVHDLATRLLINHNSSVELVDRLAKSGFVKRQRDAADRRRVKITLTPKAERLLQKLSSAHLGELQAIRPALTALLRQLV